MYNPTSSWPLGSVVEHSIHIGKVSGSIPLVATMNKIIFSFSIILLPITLYFILLPYLPKYFSFQDPLSTIDITEEYDPNQQIAIFDNKEITIPKQNLNISQVLGDTTSIYNKRIEVNLTTQTLTAFENDQNIGSFLISSGKWDRTPVGTYKIWAKIKSQKMSGGSKELGTYYYLPNVPYIMFFYNDKVAKKTGYSLHGTYWHNNFGVPMSHGCINMKTSEAKIMFDWADENTPIVIFGKYIY